MKDVKCRNCFNYRNEWCEKVADSPYPDILRDCTHFRQLTNGDRIRAMSDEDLAQFMYELAYQRKTPWSEPFARLFCNHCPEPEYTLNDGRKLRLHECDFADGKCPHGNDMVWWLGQPVTDS